MKTENEEGIALIVTLLILVLLAALLQGFVLSVNSEQELIGVDRSRNRSFYGSLAGLEKLTADLGTLFETDYSPSTSQINALTASPPTMEGISFIAPDGGSGYEIDYPVDGNGRPDEETRTVPNGPYEGLVGLITPYTMTATARTPTGAEVQMRRSLQTVAVPVFQFGIFSETDLNFHAGPDFDFGGRVHTNGDLYLAQRHGATLVLRDKVTALKEVIRTHLINGESAGNTYYGEVSVSTSPGAFRALGMDEGSLVGTVGSDPNEPTWTNLSIDTYNGNIRNGRTGARAMDLPLVHMGAAPIDLIRRPAAGEDMANEEIYRQRYFSIASLRILLSDTAEDIASLPTITASAPVPLSGNAPDGTPGTYFAAAGDSSSDYRSDYDTPLIGGFIKMEMQDQYGNWQDVTNEILSYGIAGKDMTGHCSDQPNAIIRVQRFRDMSSSYCSNTDGRKYWPNVLYDTREAIFRDNISTYKSEVFLGGVMHYVELDINNLARWFRGDLAGSGNSAINETGYVVYFSDRRTNLNETAEYGFEDFVNSVSDPSGGAPDGYLGAGEDVNGNGTLDVYGQNPILPPGALSPLDENARPWTDVDTDIARKNKPLFFRRALKLVNGASIDLDEDSDGVPYGLAITSENPIYVQGHYNAPGTFDGDHVACSIIADAVTFLSRNWSDKNSFDNPHRPSSRPALTTYYRTALISGKSLPFPHPDGQAEDFGTDGGVHNFIRFLENWGGQTLYYRGSIVSLFTNRQAVGIYKCCNNVYSPPSRGYRFDVEFLDPDLLPPRTPMFRDVNITGFTQLKMPE
jgi:hypothetical protein